VGAAELLDDAAPELDQLVHPPTCLGCDRLRPCPRLLQVGAGLRGDPHARGVDLARQALPLLGEPG
jgi:hypothetical protein